MTKPVFSSVLWALAITGSLVIHETAFCADEKAQCVAGYDQAQVLLKSNKLVEARTPLLSCGRPVCPAFVSDDCSRWLAELDVRLPTVVIEAQGPDGQDITDVSIEVDGVPFVSRIDGRSLVINPGEHRFVFRHAESKAVERRIVVAESVRGRRLSVRFERSISASQSSLSTAQRVDDARPGAFKVPSTATWALAGLGGLALLSFGYFALDYDGRLGDLDRCKPTCNTDDTDRASVSRTLAFVSGGVGVVALGVAATLYVMQSAPRTSSKPAARDERVTFDVMHVPGGALGCLRGHL